MKRSRASSVFVKNTNTQTRPIIIDLGDDADILYYFIEGSAYVRIDELDGHEFILANLSCGDFIGDVGSFEPVSRKEKTLYTYKRVCFANSWVYATLA